MDSEGPGSDELLPGLEGSAADAAVLRMRLGGQPRRFREAAGVTPERDRRGPAVEVPRAGHAVLTNAAYLEQRSDVGRYLEVVDEISSQALTPDETVRLFEQLACET